MSETLSIQVEMHSLLDKYEMGFGGSDGSEGDRRSALSETSKERKEEDEDIEEVPNQGCVAYRSIVQEVTT